MTTRPFDPTGDLPRGTVVLQASAGTGKTYALAALAVRYVAEGHHRLSDLLLITFNRLASVELRSRTYERLVDARSAVENALRGAPAPDEAITAHLADAPPAELRLRLERLDAAIGDFDAATIATIHEFCSRTLTQLGPLADHDRAGRGADDLSALGDEVIADRYLHDYLAAAAPPPFETAAEVGRLGLAHPQAPLVVPPGDGAARARADFVRQVRTEFDRRKRLLDITDYDDLIERLAACLADPISGGQARESLSTRYPVVLVDEFQDTDPRQWQILADAFAGRSTLVLLGDPKQSIYAFRGADIHAYHDAAAQADQVLTLDTNYRADPGIVAGVTELFAGADLGTPEAPIQVPSVRAHHRTARLRRPETAPAAGQPPVWPAVQIRRLAARAPLAVAQARTLIAADLTAVVTDLLTAGYSLTVQGRDRPLVASDVAVLVTTNRVGEALQATLSEAGIAAVFRRPVSVFQTPGAQAWQDFLGGLSGPDDATSISALLTPLMGLTPRQLAEPSRRLDALTELRGYAKSFADIGVAGVFEAVARRHDLVPRLLAQPEGERLLVDLRHVAEALNTEQHRHAATAGQLIAWLQSRRLETSERPDDERARRLETDRRAIAILTIHAAKGQEFPVVLLPQAADHRVPDPSPGARLVRDAGAWAIDLGDPGRDAVAQTSTFTHEDDAEAMRLLYVGVTRAQSRVVAWWAPTKTNTDHSGLHRLIQGRADGFDPALVETVTIGTPSPAAPPPSPGPRPPLHARAFTRPVDRDWTRTSYTGLTAEVHAHGVSPPLARGDEPQLDEAPEDADADPTVIAPVPGPFDGLGAGPQFGTVVHAVLEQVDPASPHLADDLARLCADQARRRWLPLDAPALARALHAVLRTPLGSVADGRCLADIGATDRLAEVSFELPLGAGDHRQTLAEVAELFSRHVPRGDPLAGYADHLASSAVAPRVLAGFLTGSIDALWRLPSSRFFLVDYKTNLLPSRTSGGRSDYHPTAMAQAMIQAHYPLQALLYAVATRRFLTQRVPGYDHARDFVGIGYLFVRGMTGPDTPVVGGMPCGVFTWRPTAAFVRDASLVLAGEKP